MGLTRKDRILGLIRRRDIDRLPSDIWLSNRAKDKLRQEMKVSNDELMKILDNHIAMVYSLDNHIAWEDENSLNIAIKRKYFKFGKGKRIIYDNWGVGWDISHEGMYEVYNPLSNANNLDNYIFPDPTDQHLLELAKATIEKYKDRYCIGAMQDLTLFERACAVKGFSNFLMDIKINVNFAEELLDKIMKYQIELAKKFIEMGVDCVITGGDAGTQNGLIISVDDWKKFIGSRLKQIWDVYKKANIPIIHHSCGNILKIIPCMVEMGLDVLNPVQHVMPPEILKKQFDKRIIFFGGIDTQKLLPFGTPKEIDYEVKRYVETLGKSYIIAPDQCIMSDVPLKNILALLNAIKKYAYLPFN